MKDYTKPELNIVFFKENRITTQNGDPYADSVLVNGGNDFVGGSPDQGYTPGQTGGMI